MVEGGLVLRPRPASGTVDLGVALLRAELVPLVKGLWPWFLAAGVVVVGLDEVSPWLGVIGAMGLGRLLQAPVTRRVGDRATSVAAAVDVRVSLRAWARTAIAAGFFFASALLFPPVAVYLLWRWVYLPEVVLLERPARGAFDRANVVAGLAGGTHTLQAHVWLVLIELFGAFGLAAGLRFLADGVLQVGDLGGWTGPTLPLGILLVQPVLAAVRFAFYLDARTRAEALDAWFALWTATEGA